MSRAAASTSSPSSPASGARGGSNSSNAATGNKQQQQAHPAQTQSQAGAPAASLPLSELLGTSLRLTLNTGSRDKERPVVTGHLWCYDPSYGCLVLSQGTGFRIVKLSSIQAVQVLAEDKQQSSAQVELKAVNPDRIREREQAAVSTEQKRLANLPPPGVSELGRELYEALGKTMPVRWAGTTIVVMEEVLVEAPYDPSRPDGVRSNDAQRKDRVTKVLQGERSKLERNRPDLFASAAKG